MSVFHMVSTSAPERVKWFSLTSGIQPLNLRLRSAPALSRGILMSFTDTLPNSMGTFLYPSPHVAVSSTLLLLPCHLLIGFAGSPPRNSSHPVHARLCLGFISVLHPLVRGAPSTCPIRFYGLFYLNAFCHQVGHSAMCPPVTAVLPNAFNCSRSRSPGPSVPSSHCSS